MRKAILAVLLPATAAAMSAAAASMSEITVDLRMDASDYVVGERVRAVVDIVNSSPDTIGIGGKVRVWGNEGSNRVVRAEYDVNDRFFSEVYRTGDMSQLAKVSRGAFVADFAVETGEGQKLETFIGDHFALGEPNRYMAKPVFVHAGVRYEGQPRVFDMVEGVRAVAAMQMFANRKSLQREFSLVYWARGRSEHMRLAVSTQHYYFSLQAFINVAEQCASERYDFTLRECATGQIIEDVRTFRSDIGVSGRSRTRWSSAGAARCSIRRRPAPRACASSTATAG